MLMGLLIALPMGALAIAAPSAAAPAAPPSQAAPRPYIAPAHAGHETTAPFRALVFSKTAAFRHGSIPAGIAAIKQLGAEHDFTVDTTEDGASFTDENLAKYAVVIWLSTTGDVLNADQQAAFERYIAAGGGYAGIHAASDTEYDWPWYGELVGAYFKGHPQNQDATVKVEDHAHPSTAGMAPLWERYDEWYNYRTNPRGAVHVLASLDESTYSGGDMGVEHPISWCRDFDGGRSWYTGMGHTDESFSEPQFLDHLLGGIRTAAGVQPADCSATLTPSFEKVTLDDNTRNPMELTIAEDGRVFYADRNGDVRVVQTNGNVSTAGHVNVYTGQEFGLLGIALAPDFATSNQLFLYYSPAGSESVDRVSRFTLNGNTLDLASEKVVLTIPVQRDECCHAGGALEFDHDGNLYIATGDNTNPFASDGYAPTDERPGRAAWDAQRTSANTNALNGKILRITPQADGTYTVPDGNLFAPGTDKTRPEIFAMGFRNPFRIGLDEQSGAILVADYGPDAGATNANRGPDGRVEWNIVKEPGFYGWPYCVGDNTPYRDYDFATGTSGPAFDCGAPTNNSPNNTGLTQLPPAKPAVMWQGKSSTANPEIGGSGAPMTSGSYAYDPDLASDRKWPAYFDGKVIWADWNNSRLFTVQLDEARTDVVDLNRFLGDMGFNRPHALQFGPDGALYMIEWGSGFGGDNADSGVYRIDYVRGSRAPIAHATADRTSGPAPLTVEFDGSSSRHPDGTPITFAWDFDGDGTTDSTEATVSHTYTEVGDYTARLTVTDVDGRTAVSNLDIVVGNSAPTVKLDLPLNGGFFEFGDTVRYKVTVTDPEDGQIDCNDVIVQPALGHDEHAHGYEQYRGCEGSFPIPGDEGHVGANIFGTITATYTDKGAPGASPLKGQDTIVLHTKRTEAEFFDTTGRLKGSTSGGDPGVRVEDTGDTAGGGKNVGYIEPGDWFGWKMMNLTGIDQITMRAASPQANGATYEIRTGDPDTGPTVATIKVGNTGDWQKYDYFSAVPTGETTTVSGPLYFVETAGGSNINWIDFEGRGVTDNQRPKVTASATPTSGTAPLDVHFTASATDPDGDEPLTYAWAFGDGGTADTADASHTYTAAGTYAATLTVTDSRGASATTTVTIKVYGAPAPACFTGRSDDFLGAELDHDRWSSIIRENQDYSVSDGQLHLPLTATDIHGGNNTGTPNIVTQALPGGPFEVTSKVTLAARQQYQQAGLIIYGNDDNYMKMVMQGRSVTDDASARVFQFLSEYGASPTETNTPALGAEFPDTFWVRLSSADGVAVTASYSEDGLTFTPLPDTRTLTGISNPKVGLFAAANRPEALPMTAHFDTFSITPDDSAPRPDPSDDFEGTQLDMCRWDGVVRYDPTHLTVADGRLTLETTPGDVYGTDNSGPKNFVLQTAPEGNWVMETKVDASAFDARYQQAGLIAYLDDANYLKLDHLTTNAAGSAVTRGIEMRSEIDDVVQNPQPNASPAPTQGVWHLRLAKKGSVFTGSYSADGKDWTKLGEITNAAIDTAALRIGVFTLGAESKVHRPAHFDYVRIEPAVPSVTVALDPAEPNGTNGWYTGPVTVTASAEGGTGDLVVERSVDGGEWTSASKPLVVNADGTTTVRHRVTDAVGRSAEAEPVTVRVDATAPTVKVTSIRDGDRFSVEEVREAVVEAADATSGIADVVVTIDGDEVTSPVTIDAAALRTGEHELVATVVDEAGNETVHTVTFTVHASYDGGFALVDRFASEQRITAKQADHLRDALLTARKFSIAGKSAQAGKQFEKFDSIAKAVKDQDAAAALLDLSAQLRQAL
jgi:PKD repeat protein/glucose/arabinose dehydrogenase